MCSLCNPILLVSLLSAAYVICFFTSYIFFFFNHVLCLSVYFLVLAFSYSNVYILCDPLYMTSSFSITRLLFVDVFSFLLLYFDLFAPIFYHILCLLIYPLSIFLISVTLPSRFLPLIFVFLLLMLVSGLCLKIISLSNTPLASLNSNTHLHTHRRTPILA